MIAVESGQFLQGAAGDILPLEAFHDSPGPERVMGARLALEALHAIADADPRVIEIESQAYGSVTPITLYRRRVANVQPRQELAVRRDVLELPLLAPPTLEAMRLELAERGDEIALLRARDAGRDQLNPIMYHVRWLEAMIECASKESLPVAVHGEVWAARIGDVAIVGTPGELFSELEAEVRRRLPFATTLFAGYCQGVLGYIATAEEYAFGGYEPTTAQRGYGQPAPFAPEAGRMLVERSVELLLELEANG